jgi:hypothetical protein
MLSASELAGAVAALTPFFSRAADEGAKKLGGAAAEHLVALYDKLKARLTSPRGREALAEAERSPLGAEAQTALRSAVEAELALDPGFYTELAAAMQKLAPQLRGGCGQSTLTVGDGNVSAQIAGSGNVVRVDGPGGARRSG